MGRMMSPDPYMGNMDITNPQSLNRYAYVLNNPLKYTDLTGLDCVYFNDAGNAAESVDRNINSGECGSNGGDSVNGTTSASQVSTTRIMTPSVFKVRVRYTTTTLPPVHQDHSRMELLVTEIAIQQIAIVAVPD
jgi:hypothetical protein